MNRWNPSNITTKTGSGPARPRSWLITGWFPLWVAFAFLTLISWHRWPDLLIDYGQQLYLPWVLSKGQVLYRDAQYLHGSLSAYIHALVFHLFGPGMRHLALFNLALIGLVTFLIYRLSDYFSEAVTATLVSLTFLIGFAFAHHMGFGSFNFVAPYLYDLTHGILLSIFSLFLFYRYLKAPRLRTLCGLGLALGMIFLTKVEVFLAALLGLGGGLWIYWSHKAPSRKFFFLTAGLFTGCALVPVLLALLYFSLCMPVADAWEYVFRQYRHAGDPGLRSMPYYQITMGFLHLESHLRQISVHALGFAATGGLVLGLNQFLVRKGFTGYRASNVAGVAALLVFILMFRTIPWLELPRSIPLFLFMAGGYLAWRLRRDSGRSQSFKRRVAAFSITLFAFALTFKAIFNLRLTDLGFALALPATLVFVFMILHSLPRLAGRIAGHGRTAQALCRVAVIFFLAVLVPNSYFAYQNKMYPVGQGPDLIYDFQPMVPYPSGQVFIRGLVVNNTLDYLKTDMKDGDTLVAMPDAMIFNYLLRKPFPTRDTLFSPISLTLNNESSILQRLKNAAPSHILLVHADYRWFGPSRFGTDYATRLYGWIMNEYFLAKQFGARPFTGPRFGTQIWKRKPTIEKVIR